MYRVEFILDEKRDYDYNFLLYEVGNGFYSTL